MDHHPDDRVVLSICDFPQCGGHPFPEELPTLENKEVTMAHNHNGACLNNPGGTHNKLDKALVDRAYTAREIAHLRATLDYVRRFHQRQKEASLQYHEEMYVLKELNLQSFVPCNDTLNYASLQAEPDFRPRTTNPVSPEGSEVLIHVSPRPEKSMGIVAKEVKQMSQEDILAFEKAGEATFAIGAEGEKHTSLAGPKKGDYVSVRTRVLDARGSPWAAIPFVDLEIGFEKNKSRQFVLLNKQKAFRACLRNRDFGVGMKTMCFLVRP
ncbi:hypothetical protein LguiA_017441 [Lonicera macranthoides]